MDYSLIRTIGDGSLGALLSRVANPITPFPQWQLHKLRDIDNSYRSVRWLKAVSVGSFIDDGNIGPARVRALYSLLIHVAHRILT